MQDFRGLRVWRKAHEFVLSAYRVTAAFPREEQFALTSQIRRAATSIPANIAEGCGRGSDADFGRFLQMAIGSANELEYHLLLACDLDFISRSEHQSLAKKLIEIRKMLTSLTQKLRPVGPPG
ncbi:MAG: four helix bundle protein [Betaproteobacteria bacterium]|nr:four helix bundle protein [Betaproteobacteria bacterium]